MAADATLVSWAGAMSFNEAADVLQRTLDEKGHADAKLTSLADHGINQDAADAAYPEADIDAEIEVPVSRRNQVTTPGTRKADHAIHGAVHRRR